MSCQRFEFAGMRVPYVGLWSSEIDRYIDLDTVMLDGRPALFNKGTRGEGRPIFGKMSDHRQRECAVFAKCQICRRQLRPPFMAIDVTFSSMEHAGRRFPLLTEPFVCRRCGIYSLKTCPGLISAIDENRIQIFHASRYEQVLLWIHAQQESEYPQLDEALRNFGKPVVSIVKMMLTRYVKISDDEIEAMINPQRQTEPGASI